jgi:beta-glucosidase
MLKNDGAIKAVSGKPTVYIPLRFTPSKTSRGVVTPASWSLPVDLKEAEQYYTVITDTVNPSGPAGGDGKPTVTYKDVIKARSDELAKCDYAIVFVTSPDNELAYMESGGYDNATEEWIPVSLQYRPYTATSSGVRAESISGDITVQMVSSVYGDIPTNVKENRSYYGHTSKMTNEFELDNILNTVKAVPETCKVIVAANALNPFVVGEFESQVDAILIGFDVNNSALLQIAAGAYESRGLLPMQMPKDMAAVEAQYEDVPRDMECYVDAQGNTYDFAFGLNWSGVINTNA